MRRASLRFPSECAGRGYPFTAPAVRPATIRCWKMSTRTISGMVTTHRGGHDLAERLLEGNLAA